MSLFKESRVCVCEEVFIIAASPTVWIVLVPCWQTVANPEHSRIGNWMDSIKPLWSGLEELCLLETHTHTRTSAHTLRSGCWHTVWVSSAHSLSLNMVCDQLSMAGFCQFSACVCVCACIWNGLSVWYDFPRRFFDIYTLNPPCCWQDSPRCVCSCQGNSSTKV